MIHLGMYIVSAEFHSLRISEPFHVEPTMQQCRVIVVGERVVKHLHLQPQRPQNRTTDLPPLESCLKRFDL